MTDRVGEIIGRIRRKLKTYKQTSLEDPDILDALNEISDEIFMYADIETKITVTLVGDQEEYDFAAVEAFEVLNTMPSWEEGWQFVPNSEWEIYKQAEGSYPYYMTIFDQALHLAPIPTTDWVTEDAPTIEFWGHQKKRLTAITESVDPELPDIFDRALVFGVCKEYDERFMGDYLAAREEAITTYQNKKLGIQPPDPEW